VTPDALRAIARDPSRHELTRRAAREALVALHAVRVRLAVDAQAPRHERPDGDAAVVCVLGPAPLPNGGVL